MTRKVTSSKDDKKVTHDSTDSLIHNLRDIISLSGPEQFLHRLQLANSFVAHLKANPKMGTIFSTRKKCTGRGWKGKNLLSIVAKKTIHGTTVPVLTFVKYSPFTDLNYSL